MKTCAIVGINWGDEGKGRMVDLLTEDFDVVIRYQGGGNAGHTVVNDYGKFALHLLPSGVFHPGVVNILGCCSDPLLCVFMHLALLSRRIEHGMLNNYIKQIRCTLPVRPQRRGAAQKIRPVNAQQIAYWEDSK